MDRDVLRSLTALSTGNTGALVTLVGILIDKGLITPEEVITRFDHTADEALQSDGGTLAARPSQTIVDFVSKRTGVKGRSPS